MTRDRRAGRSRVCESVEDSGSDTPQKRRRKALAPGLEVHVRPELRRQVDLPVSTRIAMDEAGTSTTPIPRLTSARIEWVWLTSCVVRAITPPLANRLL